MATRNRSQNLERGILRYLRKFARNEYDFIKATNEDLHELQKAITDFFTIEQRKNLSIENKSLKDFLDDIHAELVFRLGALRQLDTKQKVKIYKRHVEEGTYERDVAALTLMSKYAKLKTLGMQRLGLELPVPELNKKQIQKIAKTKKKILSAVVDPIKTMQTIANKIFLKKQDPIMASFDDFIGKQHQGLWNIDKKLHLELSYTRGRNPKRHKELLAKAKQIYTLKTGINI